MRIAMQIDWLVLGYFVFSLVAFPLGALLPRNAERRKEVSYPRLVWGTFALATGISGFAWVMFRVIAVAIVAKLNDPCYLLGLATIFVSLGTICSGLCLLLYALKKDHMVPRGFKVSADVFLVVLLLILYWAFPLQRVSGGQEQIILSEGRVLQSGESYQFFPGRMTPPIFAFDNPTKVSTSTGFNFSDGKFDLYIEAQVRLGLKPGDRVPQGFLGRSFEQKLKDWFVATLQSSITGGTSYKDFIESPHVPVATVIDGVSVTWDGKYKCQVLAF
ncbi:hypothetical protein D4R52_00530 [bacterium]|nr:MAG: hypothetical protein D4R52_00530 [bacterium]